MKMLFQPRVLLLAALCAAAPQGLLAQTRPNPALASTPTAGTMPLSLQQAVNYAV